MPGALHGLTCLTLLPEEAGRESAAWSRSRSWCLLLVSCLASGLGQLAIFDIGLGAISCKLLSWGSWRTSHLGSDGLVLDTRQGHYLAHSSDEVLVVEGLRFCPKPTAGKTGNGLSGHLILSHVFTVLGCGQIDAPSAAG